MFILDPQLHQDTFCLGFYPLSTISLMNDQRFPWVILVPRIPNIIEITDFSEGDYKQFTQEMRHSVAILQNFIKPDKINIAALGNKVRQYHFHIVARFITDAAWPQPVWGFQKPQVYLTNSEQTVSDYQQAFRQGSCHFNPQPL